MQNRNPYAAPQTNVARGESAVEEFGDVKVFSVSGRIGRVRYIAHSIGLSLLVMILAVLLAGMASIADESAAIAIVVIGYIAMYAIVFVPGIQRSHDMNVTGWLSLITLIPLGVLVFWFVPGTRGENDYGKQPPPNGVGAILVACVLPVLFTTGMLAAIAIPAYQDYSIRAQVSEGLNLAAGPKAAVAEAFQRNGTVPVNRLAVGLSEDARDNAGKYVDSVDVVSGTVVVSYGGEANALIAGGLLAIQPYVMRDDSIVWRCGQAPAPDGGVAMDAAFSSADVTDVETRHLPSACRP
jgi:uncharacterized membrane protein YhaH (DUF805 family)/Tfp pilus assembly major pilin PilA